MSILTDVDIRSALGKDIVIEPFADESLSPVGYDFRIGNFVFSLEHGLLQPQDGIYNSPPKSTIQILTRESLWVSSRIAGTFHSRVSLVSMGLSHISTTLDPGWYGPLLITIRNNTDKAIPLNENEAFVTCIFYRVSTPTKFIQRKFTFVSDILLNQLENQTADYVARIRSILVNANANEEFERQVKDANAPMAQKVVASIKALEFRAILMHIFSGLIWVAITALATLMLYWDRINDIFHGIAYDSKVFAVQITAIVSLLALAVAMRRK